VGVPAEVGCDLRPAVLLAFALVQTAFIAKADTYFLTVAGLGGEQEYEQRFSGWAKDLDKVLRSEPGAKVDTLFGADATKMNVEAKMRAIASQAKADDEFVLCLIGHGTFDEREYKFSLPGPDISATELAALLDKIPARELVVNMTSSSGGSIPILEKPKRVIITATKTGNEKNLTSFARYFIEALRDPSADADKNETISALEAFKYAEAKTAKFYESNNHLATEHALLEDAGKGDGVKDPSAENGEGLTATRFNLIHLGSVAGIAKDPAKQQLLKHKEEVESAIDELKYRKASMDVAEYRVELQQYLLDLAKTQAELDK
jgi:hypothetical protein